jgi:hypothetical protein
MSTQLNRRAVLAGAAALPAVSVPALVAGADPDPIFAAIEAHRAARKRLDTEAFDDADDCPEWHEANDATDRAAADLAETKPVTIAGAAALMRYIVEIEEQRELPDVLGRDDWASDLHRSLADALEEMAVRS